MLGIILDIASFALSITTIILIVRLNRKEDSNAND